MTRGDSKLGSVCVCRDLKLRFEAASYTERHRRVRQVADADFDAASNSAPGNHICPQASLASDAYSLHLAYLDDAASLAMPSPDYAAPLCDARSSALKVSGMIQRGRMPALDTARCGPPC